MSKKSKRQLKKEKLLRQSFKKSGRPLTTRNVAAKHHYVPVWYQKRFIPHENENYFCLRKAKGNILNPNGTPVIYERVFPTGPRQCFVEGRLYTVSLLGVRDEAIETRLFGRIDSIGSKSFDSLIDERGWCQEGGTDRWRDFLDYMGAQKLRTPKGLDWIRALLRFRSEGGIYFPIDKNIVLAGMQQLIQMHSTIWTESIWEIVSAKNSDVKFIVSDHPVTTYNCCCPPESAYCLYPLDPLISLIGTHTIFAMDMNHCLILTNRQYALTPDSADPLAERINPRYFDKAIFCFTDIIRGRELTNVEVATINFILKARARECIAAGKEEWLYPEKMLETPVWKLAGALLRPQREKVRDTQSIFFGHIDGSLEGYDPYGREIKDPREFESIKQGMLVVKKHVRQEHFCKEVAEMLNAHDRPNIDEQNTLFLDATESIFGLSKGRSLNDIRHSLSDDEVVAFYRLIEDIWPAGLDTLSVLPKPDEKFTILYSGEINANSIAKYLLSFGLYADRILMVNPFPNPCCIKEDKNPILNPGEYKVITYRLLFILVEILEPWIRSEIVRIIPNPVDVDFAFRKLAWENAQKRREQYKLDGEQVRQFQSEFVWEILWRTPKVGVVKNLKEMYPDMSDEDVNSFLHYIDEIKKGDVSEYLPSLDETGPQFLIQNFGLNLEALLYIAQATGAVPYTYLNVRKWELDMVRKESTDSEQWSTLSKALSSIRFKFLNFAEGHFAHTVRSKGLLESFRSYLRKLKNSRYDNGSQAPKLLAKDLEKECLRAQQDWGQIEKELENILGKENYKQGLGASFEGVLIPDFDSCSVKAVTDHLVSVLDRDEIKGSVPMTLYMRSPTME